ncbi:MAG: hypothetical protein JF571_00710 [Asticcacaulis sp.]|nr:hypothetical protein [Asticcacaulis sp.]
MKRIVLLALLVAAPAQAGETAIDGTWKGSSTCQVKPSPCHDEMVVYRARQTGPDSHRIRMYKVVAGHEAFMGEVIGTYSSETTFRAISTDRRRRPATWTFAIAGDHMSGKLTLSDGTLFRVIAVDRAK